MHDSSVFLIDFIYHVCVDAVVVLVVSQGPVGLWILLQNVSRL